MGLTSIRIQLPLLEYMMDKKPAKYIIPLNYYIFSFFLAYVSSIIYFPLEVGGTSIISRVVPIALLAVITIININLDIKLTVSKGLVILSLCLLIGGISSFFSLHSLLFYFNFAFLSLAAYLSFSSIFERFGEEFIYKVFRAISIFSVLISALGVVEYYFYDFTLRLWFFRGTPYYESMGQVSSLYSNPNIFGIITAISIQLAFMVYKANYFGKTLFIISVLILLLGVYYSGARMAQAIAIIVILYHIFYRWRLPPFLMVLTSYFTLVVLSLGFDYLSSLINLNFRDVVWGVSKDIFYNDIFFGVGMGNLQEVISSYDDRIAWKQGANNYVWGFLTECGLIFFSLFSYLILSVFWGKSRSSDFNSNMAFLVSIMLVSQFSEHFLMYVAPFVIIFFLILAVMSKKLDDYCKSEGRVNG